MQTDQNILQIIRDNPPKVSRATKTSNKNLLNSCSLRSRVDTEEPAETQDDFWGFFGGGGGSSQLGGGGLGLGKLLRSQLLLGTSLAASTQ